MQGELTTEENMCGADPMECMRTIVQEISDPGRGGDLVNALNDKEIRNDLHRWGAKD